MFLKLKPRPKSQQVCIFKANCSEATEQRFLCYSNGWWKHHHHSTTGSGWRCSNSKTSIGNAANVADPQHPLEITADGQVGARNIIPPNPSISESPLIPQPNAEMIMASAAGGMFSIEAANQYVNLMAAQQN